MSPDSSGDMKAPHRYVVDEPHRCHACTARDLKAKAYAESPSPHVLRYPVRRVENPKHTIR